MKKIVAGFALIVAVLVAMIVMPLFGVKPGKVDTQGPKMFTLILFMGSLFILWVWMLIDLLKRKDLKNKFLWGIFLIFANWLASIFYFLIIYFPRERRKLKNG